MMVCRGEIWLVNLNPTKKSNEMGKVRPVVVFQNDELNHSDYPTTIVIPLSTSLVDDSQPIRMRVSAREDLEKFFGKQIHLATYVKVNKDWRSNERQLRRFGYNQK